MAALEAGQAAGGDTRGMQSAAMLIVGKGQGVWLNNDVVLRLQVDDSPEPIKEMRRLVESWNERRREGPAAAGQVGPQTTDRVAASGERAAPPSRFFEPLRCVSAPNAARTAPLLRDSSKPLTTSVPPGRLQRDQRARGQAQHAAGEVGHHEVGRTAGGSARKSPISKRHHRRQLVQAPRWRRAASMAS